MMLGEPIFSCLDLKSGNLQVEDEEAGSFSYFQFNSMPFDLTALRHSSV